MDGLKRNPWKPRARAVRARRRQTKHPLTEAQAEKASLNTPAKWREGGREGAG